MAEDEYDEKDLRTHVYDTPDTYAGSDQEAPDILPLMEDDNIIFKETEIIPVIYKMFDEIIVNARDQYERLKDIKDFRIHELVCFIEEIAKMPIYLDSFRRYHQKRGK